MNKVAVDNGQICSNCIMDTTDPQIEFDDDGVCNHCLKFKEETSKSWFPNEVGKAKLESSINKIKEEGKGKEYDCIIGLSGGIDSSYLAVKIKEYGLRPLVVHVDAGWNSELAVANIEAVVKYCDYDLHTHVMDWEEVKDLQVAYLKAGLANQDVVQDHAFFSSLYHFAVKNKIKYVINGGNIATESVFPESWHHSAMDAVNLKAIHKRFGRKRLKNFKTIGFFQHYLYYPYFYGMKTLRPLNFMEYDKKKAAEFLVKEVGYKEYGRKHGESIFTRFFQDYYLPRKFGIDKRKIHYSSMILSGQLSRKEALKKMEEPLYESRELTEDLEYVAKKLDLTVEELIELIDKPGVHYDEYPNWDSRYRFMKKIQNKLERLLGKKVGIYG